MYLRMFVANIVIVCTPPPLLSAGGMVGGGGGLNLLPNFQKGGRAWQGLNFERGVPGKEGLTFFRGRGYNFYKKKLKSEILNDKKSF